MSKVYRVESPATLIGPYSEGYGDTTIAMRDDHNNSSIHLHPSPFSSWNTSMLRLPSTTRCAFDSMHALFRWFGGWLPGLLREGFKISVVEDVTVTHGPDATGQVLFLENRKVPW